MTEGQREWVSDQTRERVLAVLRQSLARGIVAPTATYLALQTGLAERSVYRALRQLEAQGRIRRHRIEVLDGGNH